MADADLALPVEYFDEVTQISVATGTLGYIHVILDYGVALDPARLGTALRRLIDAEPVLGCRFDGDGGKPVWRRRDDLDEIARLALTVSTDRAGDTASWLAEWRVSANIGCRLLRAADGTGDRLLLRFSHAAGDAASTVDAVAQLAGLYTRLGSDPDTRPAPNTAGRGSFRWLETFSLKDRLRLVWRELGALRRALRRHRGMNFDDATAFFADLEGVTPAYRTLRFDADRVAAIDRYASSAEVVLNDILLTATMRAFDAFCPSPADTDLAIMLPVNLRRYAETQRRPAFMNLTGGVLARIRPIDDEPFEQTLAKVRHEMARHRRHYLGTEGQLLHLCLSRLSFARKRRLFQQQFPRLAGKPLAPALSNLGRVKAARFAFDDALPLDAALLVLAAPLPMFAVTAIRLDDTVSVSLCFDRRSGVGRIDAFLRQLDRDMPGFAIGPAPLEGA